MGAAAVAGAAAGPGQVPSPQNLGEPFHLDDEEELLTWYQYQQTEAAVREAEAAEALAREHRRQGEWLDAILVGFAVGCVLFGLEDLGYL